MSKRPARLTRREKIEQAAAVKAKVIENPRHLIGLPPGTYTLSGEAAEQELTRQLLVANPEKR